MSKHRHLRLILLAGSLLLIQAAPLWAANAAKAVGAAGWRGPGFYFSGAKILSCWLLFLAWVLTTDWASRDAQAMKLNYLRWNPLLFGAFLAAWAPFFLIPLFWVGYPLLVIAYLAPLTAYIVYRNKHVHVNDKVLTAEHLRWELAELLGKMGVQVAHERRDPNVFGAPVGVFARGGPDERTNGARLLAARQSPGLAQARELLCDVLANRATGVTLDFTAGGVAVRYMIDSVWQQRERRESEDTDPAMIALKLLCGMKPQERRERQEGQFGLEYSALKYSVFDKLQLAKNKFKKSLAAELTKKMVSEEEVEPDELERRIKAEVEEQAREKFATPIGPWTPVDKSKPPKLPGIDQINTHTQLDSINCPATMVVQGTETGQRVLIQLEIKSRRLKTLDDLGMREKMHEQLKTLLGQPKGLVLFSALPHGGLRTTLDVVLHSMDRFVREFIALEAETNRYPEVENIPVTTYNTASGQTPAAMLVKVFRNEPQVVVIRDLADAELLSLMCRETVSIDRLLIGTIRAKNCTEALLRVLRLKVPLQEFAPAISGVVCQRLLRKLCDNCKEPYTPSPEILQQLGLPEGQSRTFYRPPRPKPDEDKEEVCPECGGIGYRGQTAIFELLVIDDAIRKVLSTTPKFKLLRQAARKAGARTLQEEGILLAARGATSLTELMRVMKQ